MSAIERIQHFFVVLLLCLCAFLAMVDTTIANLALGRIASSLHINIFDASFVITSYGTGLVISFSLSVWLSKHYSSDAIFVCGALLFMLSSFACGIEHRANWFFTWRFVQGISAGMLLVTSQSSMIRVTANKAIALSLWGSAVSLAPVFGSLFGAVIIEYFNWRWLFFVNVPLMAICLIFLASKLTIYRIDNKGLTTPLVTVIWFAIATTAMQYTFEYGANYDWFNHIYIQITAIISLIATVIFFLYNRRQRLFDLSIFRDRHYSIATTVLSLGHACIFTSLTLLPLWLQKDYLLPVWETGVFVAIASGIAAIISPILARKISANHLINTAILGLLLCSISFYLMGQFGLNISKSEIIFSRIVAGLGIAMFTFPLTAISLSKIPQDDLINANSISLTTRVIAANLFIAFGFDLYEKISIAKYGSMIAQTDRMTIMKYKNHLPDDVVYDYLVRSASSFGFTLISLLTSAIFIILLSLMVYLRVKQHKLPSVLQE